MPADPSPAPERPQLPPAGSSSSDAEFESLDNPVSRSLAAADLEGAVAGLMNSGILYIYQGPSGDEIRDLLRSGEASRQTEGARLLLQALREVMQRFKETESAAAIALALRAVFGSPCFPEEVESVLSRMAAELHPAPEVSELIRLVRVRRGN